MRIILAILACFVLASANVLYNIYESLGITEEEAKKDLLSCMGAGGFNTKHNHELVQKARALPADQQANGIRKLIQLAKSYSESEDFKKDYKKWRNNQLNPPSKSKLGVPRLGKMLDKAVDNQLDKGENEKKYPSDANEMIRKRLEDFLKLSATVDFEATLTESKTFTNPDYEKKSGEWKMCYRAGKEVVQAAREEAQKWLDELNAAKK